jgi:hypothetical protein
MYRITGFKAQSRKLLSGALAKKKNLQKCEQYFHREDI